MKTKIISVALLAVLSSMAVGCQKETLVEPQGSVAEVGIVRTVLYTIDGVEQRATLYGDEEWKTFIDNVIELSGQGHEINIVDENAAANGIATKETQTYTTTNKDAAATWTAEKVDNGYHVTVVHNTTSGEYTCIATNKRKHTIVMFAQNFQTECTSFDEAPHKRCAVVSGQKREGAEAGRA